MPGLCRLLGDKMWCSYDVSVCVFHNHNVCVIHFARDANSHVEVHRFVFLLFHYPMVSHLCFSSFLYVWISILFFAVQLQHHAQHRLPTFQLIFVHVIESLVFVPVCIIFFLFQHFRGLSRDWHNIIICKLQIMIGILFFLFEFYDDQLLAFMVLVLVWLCELFTLIRLLGPFASVYLYISRSLASNYKFVP